MARTMLLVPKGTDTLPAIPVTDPARLEGGDCVVRWPMPILMLGYCCACPGRVS